MHHHKHHCKKAVVKPEEPLPVTGTTENGSEVDGTLQDPTLTVNPVTGDGTISGDLNGTVTQQDGDVVQINDEQVTADVTVAQTGGCNIGFITLDGTLTVGLLGLHLVIDQLDVQLQGFPDEGVLGTVLCALAGPGGSTTTTSDTDGDGLTDDVDQCANDPGPASMNGCPISMDTVSPKGIVRINGGAKITRSRTVTLDLRATDPAPYSGVDSMRIKNAGGSWTAWQSYTGSKGWKLTRGEGKKTVYVKYRDLAGNLSVKASDSITYRP